MKLLLFDWHTGGHHATYMQRVIEALSASCSLVVAAPNDVVSSLEQHDVELVSLGRGRPSPTVRRDDIELAPREWGMLLDAIESSSADCVLHLYSDPIVEYASRAQLLPVPSTLTVFFSRWHYPWTYRTAPLPPKDAVKALLLERAIRRWRSRTDALAIFSLDPATVRYWSQHQGAKAFLFPEPPVPDIAPPAAGERRGCVLYGALAPRKGIDRLAAALAQESSGLHAIVAGAVEPGYAEELDGLLDMMRATGSTVEFRGWSHDEYEGIRLLAQARCSVLPYQRHYGMSRVVLESAAAGTPVLAHDHGLVARLVREQGLGLTVDCRDARALRRALHVLCADGEIERYQPALREFTAKYGRHEFSAALRAPFLLPADRDELLQEATR